MTNTTRLLLSPLSLLWVLCLILFFLLSVQAYAAQTNPECETHHYCFQMVDDGR